MNWIYSWRIYLTLTTTLARSCAGQHLCQWHIRGWYPPGIIWIERYKAHGVWSWRNTFWGLSIYSAPWNYSPQYGIITMFGGYRLAYHYAVGGGAIMGKTPFLGPEIWCTQPRRSTLWCIQQNHQRRGLSTVPEISIIRSIPKVKSPMECKDRRPIAITPVLSRLFERLIYNNFMEHSYSNHILGSQFGFRKFGSTSNDVIRIQNLCRYFLNANYEYVRIFSLDLSKAIDRVPVIWWSTV